MGTRRTLRVGELVKREIADILCRDIKDPKIGFVTVSSVEVTKDLRMAIVGVSVLGDEEHRQEAVRSLNSAAGFIQKELSGRIRLRYMPKLLFRLDRSVDDLIHISQVLDEIKQSDASEHPGKDQDASQEV